MHGFANLKSMGFLGLQMRKRLQYIWIGVSKCLVHITVHNWDEMQDETGTVEDSLLKEKVPVNFSAEWARVPYHKYVYCMDCYLFIY